MIHISILYLFILSVYDASGYSLPDYPGLRVCNGPETRVKWDSGTTYEKLKQHYSDCDHVRNHLIIEDIKQDQDISFLESIQSVGGSLVIVGNRRNITLPNLKIVRGIPHIRVDGYEAAVHIKHNSHPRNRNPPNKDKIDIRQFISFIDMRSLRSVANKDIVIENNFNFCYLDTINWEELLEDVKKQQVHNMAVQECPKNLRCSRECKQHPNNCWGPDKGQCQEFGTCSQTDTCSESRRCWKGDRCCNQNCAGGCTGVSASQCVACRYFQNNDHCLRDCPRRWIINDRGQKVLNPKFLLRFGSYCVKKCPDSLVEFGDTCVNTCDEGYFIKDGKCYSCKDEDYLQGSSKDKPHDCKQNCHLSHLVERVLKEKPSIKKNALLYKNGKPTFTWRSILKKLINCTRFQANDEIKISKISGYEKDESIRPEDLYNLRNIEEMHGGSLNFDLTSFPKITNLSFLSSLTVFKSSNGQFRIQYGKNLEFLGLNKLRQLNTQYLTISNNPSLCYMTTNKILMSVAGYIGKNQDKAKCVDDKKVCDVNCAASDGCWGPGRGMCVACKDVQAGENCLSSCSEIPGYFRNVSNPKRCAPCHPQCIKCKGSKPNQCVGKCRNVKDGDTCLEKCPPQKYWNATAGQCLRCSSVCKPNKSGSYCTGPSKKPAPGGCNICNYFEFDSGNNLIGCRLDCPSSRFFTERLDDETMKKYEGHYIDYSEKCTRCHPFCETCNGRSRNHCDSCRKPYLKQKGARTCLKKCRKDFFENSQKTRCIQCHKQCHSSCNGPSDYDCHRCRVLRVYTNGSQTQFQCVSDCPKDHKYTKFVDGSAERVCLTEPPPDKAWLIKVVVGSCAGVLIVIGLIALVLIWRRRAQILKEREQVRAKYTRRIEEELIPLSETGTQPNFGKLRIISAKQLSKGNRIGTGQFGTVYRGVWTPEVEEGEVPVKIDVAIKELKSTNSSTASKEFLSEAHVMASVNSPYCVHLLGVSLVSPMKLISVFVPLGNLTSYMPKHRKEITNRIILTWALQIAKGMEYLEKKGIVHRDLAARNVLLDDIHLVRITDFGLAKLVDPNGDGSLVEKGGRLPIQWLAIECLRELLFSHKSDVWAFGVTLWEILTFASERPYGRMSIHEIVDFLERGERLEQPNSCTMDFYMLLLKCWVSEEDGRPTFEELVFELTNMADDPSHYISTEIDLKLSQNRRSIGRRRKSSDKPPADVEYLDPVPNQCAPPPKLRAMNSYDDPQKESEEEDVDPVDTEYLLPDRFGNEGVAAGQTTALPKSDNPANCPPNDHPNNNAQRNQSETEIISFRSSASSNTNPNDGYMAVSTEV